MGSGAPALHLRRTLPVVIAGQGVNAVVSLVFILIVSRWLGPEGKGLHGVLSSAAQIGAVVLGFGYAGAIPFAVRGDPMRVPGVARAQGRLLLAAVALMALVATVNRVTDLWPSLFGAEFAVIALSLGWITQLFASSLALSIGDAYGSVGASLVGTALGLAGLWSFRAIEGPVTPSVAIAIQGTGLLLGAVWAVGRVFRLAARLSVGRSDRGLVAGTADPEVAVAKASVLGLTSNVASTLMVRGDVFLVEAFAGPAVAGVYSLAAFLVEIGAKIPQWAAGALTSSVAADFKSGVDRTLGLTVAAVVVAVGFFLGVLTFEPLLDRALVAFVGRGFAATLPLFLALAPRVVLQAGVALVAGNLAAHGYTKYHTGGAILGLVVMVGTDLYLVPRFAGMGAALGGFLGIAVTSIVMLAGFVHLNAVPWPAVVPRAARAFVQQSRSLRGLVVARWGALRA